MTAAFFDSVKAMPYLCLECSITSCSLSTAYDRSEWSDWPSECGLFLVVCFVCFSKMGWARVSVWDAIFARHDCRSSRPMR